jgi:hypothetical protein
MSSLRAKATIILLVAIRADGAIACLIIICRWMRCHRRSPHSILPLEDLTKMLRRMCHCTLMSQVKHNARDYSSPRGPA